MGTIDHSAEIWKLIATGTKPGRALMEEVRDLVADSLMLDAIDARNALDAQKQIADACAPAIELDLIVTGPGERTECLSLSPLPVATAS